MTQTWIAHIRLGKLCTFLIFFITLSILSFETAAQERLLLRHPSINPDGSMIAFSYQGDIWVVSTDGGDARRLTIHESYEGEPRWSPDGTKIAFQGNRYGNDDIFTVDPKGFNIERMTYHSSYDAFPMWTADGTIFFQTRRNYVQVERAGEIFRLDPDNATPYRAMDAVGSRPDPTNDGSLVAFERGGCRTAREAYRGPANRDIWVYNPSGNSYTQITTDEGQDYAANWGEDGTLYFLSAMDGKYNIYSIAIGVDGRPDGEFKQKTKSKDMGIRHFDVNGDGDIVYEKAGKIYFMENGKSKAKEIEINLPKDFRFYPVEKETSSRGATAFALSPDEKLIAFTHSNEIYVTQNDKEKNRTVKLTDYVGRDESIAWINDETLWFISDRDGKRDIYKITSADTGQSNVFLSLKYDIEKVLDTDEDEQYMVLSDDRDKLAIVRDRGQLVVYDIDTLGMPVNQKILFDGWDSPGGLSWSPDGTWLAFHKDDLDFNSEVYIMPAEGGDLVNVSMHPRNDYSPVWSKDGSKLGFISDRNGFNADVWFTWLKESDWEKTRYDWEEEDEGWEDEDKKEDDDEAEEEPMQIDVVDIHRRLRQVTREPGSEGDLAISADGETFYYTTNNGSRRGYEGESVFKQVDWDGRNDKTILSENVRSIRWDDKGKYMYYLKSGGTIARLDPGSKKTESRPFSAFVKTDLLAQREHVFEEGWKSINEGFYDPEFHGKDWGKLKEIYKPLALAASTSQDFRDMFNDMLGQINASHMGMYGSNPEETQDDRTGLLGIEIKPDGDHATITRVVPKSPADRSGVELKVGETIRSINGIPVSPDVNFYSVLDEKRNEKIYLDVTDVGGISREVIIRPTSSLGSELYESWVEERRELTERYSNGQLGYIHIQGMNWPSFEVFERELTASGLGKKGLVIDVRYNGGGWTTDMLMAVLNTRQHAYTIPRGATEDLENHKQFENNYPYGERLPFPYVKVPTIALCNEASYSNAEIFSHAYKTLNHGTLVGQPTFGAVISTGGRRMIDGSLVRMPFRGWYVKATNENMELGPAVPDMLVEYPPSAKGSGEDPQLKAAVDELLKQLSTD
jgi:Tol biopolymer transport system component/C-terminal processing protease CtpA/Prc